MIRITNYTGLPFSGWKRLNTDHVTESIVVNGASVVVGRKTSRTTNIIDVKISLNSGEVSVLDPKQGVKTPWALGPLPANPLDYFGIPKVNGVPLQFVSATPDGAAYLIHLRARTTRMLHTDVWLTYYPDQPGWCHGVAVTCASNPTIPDLVAEVPVFYDLTIKGGMTYVNGKGYGQPLVNAGETLADGQARTTPFVIAFPEHLVTDRDRMSAAAFIDEGICGNALEKLWTIGNPVQDPETSAAAWCSRMLPAARSRRHGWQDGPEGVVARSGSTGAQADQVFVGAECMAEDGVGCEQVLYLAAIGQSRRPCHHLEANGDHLNYSHSRLVIWDGRAHWHTGVSPDQLGKPRAPNLIETHGWWGPDEEHWLINTLATAYRLTGCPALQWQMEHHARLFHYQKTTDLHISTSRPGAARAVGWEGIVAYHLWNNLEDQALAVVVRDAFLDRVNKIHIPMLGAKVADIWQTTTDPRWANETGRFVNWSPYQQSLGAYGLWLGCKEFGHEEGMAMALRGARAVYTRAFDTENRGWSVIAFEGETHVPLVQGNGASYGPGVQIWHTPMLSLLPEAAATYQAYLARQAGSGKWVPPTPLETATPSP